MILDPDFCTNMLHERLYLTVRKSEAEIGMRETDSHFPILAQTGVERNRFSSRTEISLQALTNTCNRIAF